MKGMKKIILSLILLIILVPSVFSAVKTFYNCPDKFDESVEVKATIGYGLFIFLKDPSKGPASKEEFIDIITFYFSGGNCYGRGINTNELIINIANKIKDVGDIEFSKGSHCSLPDADFQNGTCYDQFYCEDGKVNEDCVKCNHSCLPGICDPSGKCNFNLGYDRVEDCQLLDEEGRVYHLTKNLTGNNLGIIDGKGCLVISSPNITLDCLDNTLISGINRTGIYSDQPYTTIRNCNIDMGPAYPACGIKLNSADYSHISDNILNNQNYGLYLYKTSFSTIENIVSSKTQRAIYLSSNSNNNELRNTITDFNYLGIMFHSSSNNTLTEISTNSNNYGIYSDYSDNNLKNVQSHLNKYSLIGYDTSNYVTDSDFSLSTASDVRFGKSENTLLNCTYSISRESLYSNANLTRAWYYQAYITDGSSPISGATVEIYDKYNSLVETLTTDSDGLTEKIELPEYINYAGSRTYYSPYRIEISKGTPIDTHQVWLDKSTLDKYPQEPIEISTCQKLTEGGRIYHLTGNLDVTEGDLVSTANPNHKSACLVITSPGITLDCKDNTITSSLSNPGIYSEDTESTIMNCNVNMGSDSQGWGILLYRAHNSYIYNNILSGQSIGLHLSGGTTNVLVENLTANSNSDHGVWLNSGKNSIFRNIITSSNSRTGFQIDTNSHNNRLINIYSTSNGHNGIMLYEASNNIIKDSRITPNSYMDIYLRYSSRNNSLVNCSYSTSKERTWDNSELIRKWYYGAHVTDGTDPVSGADLKIYDDNDVLIDTLTTDSQGLTEKTGLTHYIKTDLGTTYDNIYKSNVSHQGSSGESTFTITTNILNDELVLEDLSPDDPFELVTNGDFSDGETGWNFGAAWTDGWAVVSERAQYGPDGIIPDLATLRQSPSMVLGVGKRYNLSYEVIQAIGPYTAIISMGGKSFQISTINGLYQEDITATSTGSLEISVMPEGPSTITLIIDNISVKELS